METRTTLEKNVKKIEVSNKNMDFTFWGSDFKTDFNTLSVWPLNNGNFLCFCDDQKIRRIDSKTNSVVAISSEVHDIRHAKAFFNADLNEVTIYGREKTATLKLDADSLKIKSEPNSEFYVQLELLQADTFITRDFKDPKKLTVQSATTNKTLTTVKIKPSTQCTAINGTIVKIPEETPGVLKFLQYQSSITSAAKIVETKLRYAAFKCKSVIISNVETFPKENLLIFTAHNIATNEKHSFIVDVKNKIVVREFPHSERVIKLPEDQVYLCINSPDHSHGAAIHKDPVVWNAKSKLEFPLESKEFNDISRTRSLSNGNVVCVKRTGEISMITSPQFLYKAQHTDHAKLDTVFYAKTRFGFAAVLEAQSQQKKDEAKEKKNEKEESRLKLSS